MRLALTGRSIEALEELKPHLTTRIAQDLHAAAIKNQGLFRQSHVIVGMRGIYKNPLLFGIHDQIHGLERQHAHERLISQYQCLGDIGSILEGDLDWRDLRNFQLPAISRAHELCTHLCRIKSKLMSDRLSDVDELRSRIDQCMELHELLVERVG